MEGKVTQSGDEFVIRIPAAEGREHGFADGQIVEISPPKRRETLADMLAEMDRLGPSYRPDVVDWGPDVGAEIIRDDDR